MARLTTDNNITVYDDDAAAAYAQARAPAAGNSELASTRHKTTHANNNQQIKRINSTHPRTPEARLPDPTPKARPPALPPGEGGTTCPSPQPRRRGGEAV